MISTLCLATVLLAGPESAASDPAVRIPVPSLFGPVSWTIPAQEQDLSRDQDIARKTWKEHGAFSDPGYVFLGVLGRMTSLSGDWYDGPLEEDNYGDLFQSGTGVVGEIGGMLVYREDWRVGLYLSFGWDNYKGETISSPGGDITADDMEILTGLLGARGMFHFAELLYLEGHIAGGVAYYQAVDATQGGVSGELFAASAMPAVEVGARFGIELVVVQFEIGIGYRIQGGPKRGEDTTNMVDPQYMSCLFFELGAALRF